MFSHRGSMVFLPQAALRSALAFLNSKLAAVLVLCQTVEREWHLSEVAALPISDQLFTSEIPQVDTLLALVRAKHAGDETCRDFMAPELLQLYRRHHHPRLSTSFDLSVLLQGWLNERRSAAELRAQCITQVDELVSQLYEIPAEDRDLIDQELARRPRSEAGYSAAELDEILDEEASTDAVVPEANTDDDAEESEAEGTDEPPAVLTPDISCDLVARLISNYLKQTIETDEDGIVPLDAMHGDPALVIRLQETMLKDLGEEVARALEDQAPGYLGVANLAAWLEVSREEIVEANGQKQRVPRGFFPWHATLYRNRPIFWLLSSENFEKGRTRHTFRAYVHYLKLTPDTLPRLMAYYLDPKIEWVQREWRRAQDEASRAEGKAKAAATRTAEEWLRTAAALRDFRAALERVIQGPPHAEQVPESAKWLRRTIAGVRGGQDMGHGYRPDVDYGVRVNITPVVEQKLLPKSVLKRLGA